jgi:hypothetical protein
MNVEDDIREVRCPGAINLASVTCPYPGAVGVVWSREVMYKVMIVRNYIEGMERCPIDRRCPRLQLVSMLPPSVYFPKSYTSVYTH